MRLTIRNSDGTVSQPMNLDWAAALEKLAAYEDAEDRGLLERLPFDMKGIKLVVAERERQIDLWGDQSGNHPYQWMAILGEEYGELCEAVNETCFQNPKHPERGGKPNIVKEAVHVAAVAIAIAEAALKGESKTVPTHWQPLPKPPKEETHGD